MLARQLVCAWSAHPLTVSCSTCRRTLAEFRRTHEEACMAEARRLLTEEQWEAIQDVAFSTSYFV